MHPRIEEALEQVERLHNRQLRACEELLHFVLGVLEPWRGRPLDQAHDGVMAAIFARSLTTYWAALELGRIGFGEQAAMLNRSLFEDMVDLHWIVENPDTAVERYEAHLRHGQMVLADALRAHPDFMPADELPEFDSDEREPLDKLFGTFGHKSWTSVNLRNRVDAIEHLWGEERARRQLRFFRDLVHRENNQLLHVSAQGLNQMVRRSGPEESGIVFKLGPADDYLDRTMFGAFWIYGQSVSVVLDHFDFTERDDFDRVFGDLLPAFRQLSDDEIRTTDRNDACPCGSDKKFKHCHGA